MFLSGIDIPSARVFGPVLANHDASQRTKNRVREHNLVPAVVMNGGAVRKPCPALGGVEAILFRCDDCDWEGWLPTSEIGEG